MAYLHFSDESSQLANDFPQRPWILLPVDAQIVWQTCCNKTILFSNQTDKKNKKKRPMDSTNIYRIKGRSNQRRPARTDSSWWPCAWTGCARWQRTRRCCPQRPKRISKCRRWWWGWRRPWAGVLDPSESLDNYPRSTRCRWHCSSRRHWHPTASGPTANQSCSPSPKSWCQKRAAAAKSGDYV